MLARTSARFSRAQISSNTGPLLVARAMASNALPITPIKHWDSDKGCPYAQRSWVTLIEKGLPHENILVDLNNKPEDFKQLYASLNPAPDAAAKVPILIDGDVKLYESMVCVDYLEAAYPDRGTSLLPADAAAAARARLFVETFSSLVTPALFAILRSDSRASVEEGRQKLVAALETLDKFIRLHGSSDGGEYFLGGQFSLAEVGTLGFVQRAQVALKHFRSIDMHQMIKEKGLDRLARWVAATLARNSAVKTCPADEIIVSSWTKFVVELKD